MTPTPIPIRGARRIPLPRGNEAERCYTVLEAADLLGVGKNYIYDRINDGTLPAIPLSPNSPKSKQRIRASVLQAWMEAHEVTAA